MHLNEEKLQPAHAAVQAGDTCGLVLQLDYKFRKCFNEDLRVVTLALQ